MDKVPVMVARSNGGTNADNATHDTSRHAGNSLPLWLKPELFLDESFDPDECIAELRKYVRPSFGV
jgi:hypothetical protein